MIKEIYISNNMSNHLLQDDHIVNIIIINLDRFY